MSRRVPPPSLPDIRENKEEEDDPRSIDLPTDGTKIESEKNRKKKDWKWRLRRFGNGQVRADDVARASRGTGEGEGET